jgi:biotin carboxyl carrier protein
MRLPVELDGRSGVLELERGGSACRFSWSGGGESGPLRDASVEQVEPGIYSILLDGRSYEVKVVPGPDCLYVDVDGRHRTVRVSSPRDAAPRPAGFGRDGRQNVSSPMPGKVVRVLVAVGDTVEAGAGLLVVEAMKMQNEMKAPKAGRVVSLAAREGATVAAGETLVTLE